jgi:hypothetical protein
MTEVQIDPEFQNWIIPLTTEEYSGLEKSILEDGCRDPLVVWNTVIVDGHHRFKICNDHNIPFKTVEKGFADRDDAKIWMFHNQIARRNLVPYQRGELALKVEPLISAKARKSYDENVGRPDKSSPMLATNNKVDTREELASLAKISHGSMDKVRKIVEKAPEEIKIKLRSGETTINTEFNKIKNDEDLQERREVLKRKMEAAAALPDTIKLFAGNFLTEYNKIEFESVDCIITDPPYVQEWLHNYEAFAKAAAHVLKPGGFLISYVGHIHLDVILKQMTPYLEYYWIAMLKHSGTNAAVHSRSVQCGMKPILIFNKSPRMKPKRYFNDVIIGTGKEKDAHEWQQGEEELRQIFEPFTDPGDTILDPFMGSGTVIAMAKKMNRLAIGFDLDAENVEVVKGRLSDGAF